MSNLFKRWSLRQPLVFMVCVALTACNAVTPKTEAVQQAQLAKQPNIIFILNDDLGWGDVGYHGSPIKTPTLDGLAKRGVELNRYYTYAVCSPTRAALMTGRSSLETGVDAPIAADQVLPMDATLLPQHLKTLGYQTVMIGKWHLGRVNTDSLPFKRGFDYFYGFLGGSIDHYTHLSGGGNLDWQRNGVSVREEGYTTDLMTNDAIKQITSRDKQKPLFLYLAYDAPHDPLQAPEASIKKYADIDDPIKRNYAAMMDYFDSQLARVLATIEAEGMAQDTLIVWASDNGPQGNSGGNAGGLRGGKSTAFEGGMRVPAIAYWPGHLEGGRKLESVVTVLDWLPTFVQAAGGKLPDDKRLVGHDVMPVLKGDPQAAGRQIVMGNYVAAASDHFVSAYAWPWKLVSAPTSLVNRQQTPAPAAGDKTVMLFDIVADPTESTDVAAKYPELVKKLMADLEAAPRAPRSLSLPAVTAGGGMAGGMAGGMSAEQMIQGYKVESGEPLAESISRASASAK
jgi:arylsulfatase A-like enzyme